MPLRCACNKIFHSDRQPYSPKYGSTQYQHHKKVQDIKTAADKDDCPICNMIWESLSIAVQREALKSWNHKLYELMYWHQYEFYKHCKVSNIYISLEDSKPERRKFRMLALQLELHPLQGTYNIYSYCSMTALFFREDRLL